MAIQSYVLLEGEKADLVEEAREVLGSDADLWLVLENVNLGGHKPRDLIESQDPWKQQMVRDLLRSIKHVGMT